MKILITNHAVERYLDRIDRKISFEEARYTVKKLIQNSEKTNEVNNKGHHVWRAEGIMFIVKEDKDLMVCTTLVKPRGPKHQPMPEKELFMDLSELLPPHLR